MGFGAQSEIRTHNALRQRLLRPPRLPKLRHQDMINRLLRTRLLGVLVYLAGFEPTCLSTPAPQAGACAISPQIQIGGADAIRTHAPVFTDLAV